VSRPRGEAFPEVVAATDVGREVVEREAEALRALAARLDESFAETVGILHDTVQRGGRILLTGLGKSGLVARKVAATLRSTGAPAIFLHPAEAAHGDLGLVTETDALVAISRSGSAEALAPVLAAAERLGVPIVAWTSVSGSPLAREADVTVLLDVGPEADPDDLIPSVSSTAALALGDAVAIALFRGRGLGSEDFARLHPAGNLGRRLTLRVRDLMHRGEDLPLVGEDVGLLDCLHVISDKRLGVAVVVGADGRLAGVLTDGDVRRALLRDRDGLQHPVSEYMTRDPRTIDGGELVARAVQRMENPSRRITTLVVVDADRRPEGVLHLHDCLAAGLS
jgi:arabinose-5-phosphate isomerase